MRRQKRKQVNIRLAPVVWKAIRAIARVHAVSAQQFAERVLVRELVKVIEGKRNAKP